MVYRIKWSHDKCIGLVKDKEIQETGWISVKRIGWIKGLKGKIGIG